MTPYGVYSLRDPSPSLPMDVVLTPGIAHFIRCQRAR
jgi:hypothetical protein